LPDSIDSFSPSSYHWDVAFVTDTTSAAASAYAPPGFYDALPTSAVVSASSYTVPVPPASAVHIKSESLTSAVSTEHSDLQTRIAMDELEAEAQNTGFDPSSFLSATAPTNSSSTGHTAAAATNAVSEIFGY